MGFWSTLAQYGAQAAGGGTAGSVINDIGQIADVVAPVLSDVAKTNAQNKQTQYAQNIAAGNTQTERDKAALAGKIATNNSATGAIDAAIAEQKAQDAARTAANAAAVRGALEKNIKDVTFDTSGFKTAVPNVSFQGGLRPSAFGPELAQAGASLNASGQNELDHPPTFPEVPKPIDFSLTDPTVPAPPKASIWDELAGPLALGTTVVGKALKPSQAAGVPAITPNTPGNGQSNATGATVAPADIDAILAHLQTMSPPPQAPPALDPRVFNNITFGPGVTPAPLPGVTFENGGG